MPQRRGVLVTGAPTLDDLSDPAWRPGPLQWHAHGPADASDAPEDAMDEDEPSSLQIVGPFGESQAMAAATGTAGSLGGSYDRGGAVAYGGSYLDLGSYMTMPPASELPTFYFRDPDVTELSELEALWQAERGHPSPVELVGYVTEITPVANVLARGRYTDVCNFTLAAAGSGSIAIAMWGPSARMFQTMVRKYDVLWLRWVKLARDYRATGPNRPLTGTFLADVKGSDPSQIQICYRLPLDAFAAGPQFNMYRPSLSAADRVPPNPEVLRVRTVVRFLEDLLGLR